MVQEQVAGGLGGPRAGWVRADAGEEHLSGLDVDEEQGVVAAKRGGVDGEEVAGDGAAWQRKDSVQVTSERFGAGSMSFLRRISHTVV
jgi:hypothetical protein